GLGTPLEKFLTLRDSSTALRSARNDKDWLVAHLNELTETDFELLKTKTKKFHVAHSPRSHEYFGHSQFQINRLHALGFNICLGTDSLASNESLNLFAEMRAVQRNGSAISPEKIFEMVTVNPAAALQQHNALGRIRPGFRADLVAIPCSESRDLFGQIVAFAGEIDWVMLDGKR